MPMHKLKPCPHCGADAKLRKYQLYWVSGYRVACSQGCTTTKAFYIDWPAVMGNGQLDETTRYTSKQAADLAVETWNRRHRS